MRLLSHSIFFITALLFLSLAVFSQNRKPGFIERGIVISKTSNTPVESATLIFYPGGEIITTDEQGHFSLKLDQQNFDSVVISAIGHEKIKISYEEFAKPNRIIALSDQVIELNSVTVALNPGHQYNYISKVDIKMRDITNSQEVLRLVPGLFIGQHAGGGKAD